MGLLGGARMKLINARQVWTESQHESNVSISAMAIDKAESVSYTHLTLPTKRIV